ncbi:MAG TPA: 30S ribosomal protein S15 [Thermoplasmata archaeon]|nr:30S ribosomal protein S15 [Thermoplasmata archaeon]
MSRMHASRRGRSGSKRPLTDKAPEWVQQSPDDVKDMVAKMAGEGVSMAKIGLILRDQHAIPSVRLVTGMSMKEICAEKGVKFELPEDLSDLMRRAVKLSGHIKTNKKDNHNIRGMHLIESKIRRLVKYYTREGVLPEGWKYSLSTAALQVE